MTATKGRSIPAVGEWEVPSRGNKSSNDPWRDNEYEILPISDQNEYEIPPNPDRITQEEQKRAVTSWGERRDGWWANDTTPWGSEWKDYFRCTW